MVDSLIGSIFLAWFLSLFGFDSYFIAGVKELFNADISVGSYYLIFFLGGLVVGLIDLQRKKVN